MDFSERCRFDFNMPKLTVCLEGTDVVSSPISLSLGDSCDVLRQMRGSSFSETTTFKPDDEFLPLSAESSSSRIN